MTFQQAILALCLHLIPLIAAAGPARVHEARQGPISIQPLSQGPGPVSLQTSSSTSTTPKATTMSAPSSEPSSSSSSTISPMPSSASSSSHSVLSSPSPSGTSLAASPSSSGTSSATPQPSPSPSGIIFAVRNMTTCTSGLISWNYTGTETELSLSITNIDVDYDVDYTLSHLKARQSTVNTTIQQQLVVTNTTAQSWTWPSVNVTQGWYEIEGIVSTTSTVGNNSAPFFISNGTNVACLTATSPQASSSSSATSSTNVASIVGGVVGAVVGVVLVIIGVYWWKRKRQLVGGSGSKNRKWGSLKSTNSSIQPGGSGAQVTSSHFHTHSESMGAILQDDAGGKASPTVTPGGSDEDVTTTGEEKLVSPASSSGMSPFDALNTPIHYDRRASMYSVQTPTTVTSEGTWSRSTSRRISNQSLEQQAQRIRSSMETSTRRRSGRLSMPTLPSPSLSRIAHSPTLIQAKEEYPLSPVTPTPVNRSISTGAVSMTPRRASRKPVPQYDPSLLLEDTNADSVSTFTAGAESSQSHGTGVVTGTYGTPPDLVHKASFGDGRPVHYLIPDMPPPQQD